MIKDFIKKLQSLPAFYFIIKNFDLFLSNTMDSEPKGFWTTERETERERERESKNIHIK